MDRLIDTSLIRVMGELREWRGLPGAFRCVNGFDVNLREEALDAYIFDDLEQTQDIAND